MVLLHPSCCQQRGFSPLPLIRRLALLLPLLLHKCCSSKKVAGCCRSVHPSRPHTHSGWLLASLPTLLGLLEPLLPILLTACTLRLMPAAGGAGADAAAHPVWLPLLLDE